MRVLIISAQGDHDWRATTPLLRRILAETGRFDVRVCESPAGLTARTLADFDVVVDNGALTSPGTDTERVIAGFVESGKGLVITHGALGSATGTPMADGNQQPDRTEPARMVPEYWPAVPTNLPHTRVHFFDVKIVRPEHPIVRGMKRAFRTADAIPRGMRTIRAAEVIATAGGDAESVGGGKDEPVLIVSSRGKGRVFSFALGHDPRAMHENEFVAAFARGSEWAATGTVTLPADLGLYPPKAGAVKGLVITGGHDHEAAFDSLFDGYNDLDWMPVATSATAFRSDLRGKFDVLIMYDFSRDLDETGKKNLRDFVESGRGVVALHHALLPRATSLCLNGTCPQGAP
jgi:type 1 glutamine amidotransferase